MWTPWENCDYNPSLFYLTWLILPADREVKSSQVLYSLKGKEAPPREKKTQQQKRGLFSFLKKKEKKKRKKVRDSNLRAKPSRYL